MVKAGEPCPRCGSALATARGIEVGQVFKLFTKYSEALKATFLDENGKEKPMVMGCYGIGVSRTMAAAIEQHNDADGIIWPAAIAPFQVAVVPINTKDEAQLQLAERIYGELKAAGVDVLLDDRNERPGVKFKDADLIGYPVRIALGPKALAEGMVEIKCRRDGQVLLVPQTEYLQKVQELLAGL